LDIEKEDGEKTVKTLGICGARGRMHFTFYMHKQFTNAKTKREPLGLVGPVISLLKILMQTICKITATTKEFWNAPFH